MSTDLENMRAKLKITLGALRNIVSIAHSYSGEPMPQSTHLCAQEALDALEKIDRFRVRGKE